MSALVCGSVAYDTIMVFQDQFKNHILPDKVHILNVAFHVPEMRREFGGCATNIVYNLKLLGGDGMPMATVGTDFAPYADWLNKQDIGQKHIRVIEDTYTAQAFITTDLDDNQIIAFHPGAMDLSHRNRIDSASGITLGMISPDGREGMIEHATQFAEAGIPFIFDPGQGLPLFSGEELTRFIDQADYVCVNDYEGELLAERTGLSPHEIAERVQAFIITRGAKGSEIYLPSKRIDIPAAKAEHVVDPTGCGDAYRGGLIYGIQQGMDWEHTGRVASLMGAIKVACHGTQNHSFDRAEFEQRFADNFGYRLEA